MRGIIPVPEAVVALTGFSGSFEGLQMRRNVLSRILIPVLLLVLVYGPGITLASETTQAQDPAARETGAQDADAVARVRNSLRVLIPSLTVDSVSPSPVPGLYEVTFGSHIVYVSGDGKYLVQGEITDLMTREPITERRKQGLMQAAIEGLSEQDMIIYGDSDLPHTVTVFTDIDCGYCRKLHSQMADYNKRGIRVRYLAYPRAGVGSGSYRDAVSVWCADDPKAAMTRAKRGEKIPARECENPVSEHFQLGQDFGIRGTPTMVLDDGELIPGYVPPERLGSTLEKGAN